MITEHDLQEAIAECQGKRNPDASTCIKLAAFYTIRDHMKEAGVMEDPQVSYSYASSNDVNIIDYTSDTEFAEVINGRTVDEILPVIDELMTTLRVVNPRLYNSVMRRL